MFRRGKALVRNAETGEINTICVEAEEGVPMGSEAGGPKPLSNYSLIEAIKTFPELFLLLGCLGLLGFMFIGFFVKFMNLIFNFLEAI